MVSFALLSASLTLVVSVRQRKKKVIYCQLIYCVNSCVIYRRLDVWLNVLLSWQVVYCNFRQKLIVLEC